ncbi:MAG: flagellar protein FlgN [Gammaproteobacteria bacterium]|jgi:flagellar biosynthesis/type III secretory pathway chaperone
MTFENTRGDAAPDRLSSINDVLRAQLDALARIEAILADEHEALSTRNPEALLRAADAKTAALASLGDLESQRKTMTADLDSEHLRALQDITARCRSMNRKNAALLNAQQQHVNRLLSLLRGGRTDSTPSSYDASGKTPGNASQQLRLTQV